VAVPASSHAAFISPVYVTAGSVGEAALGAPTNYYVSRSDEAGTYWPSPGAPGGYFGGLSGRPFGITVGPDKNLYVAVHGSNAVQRVTLGGVTSNFVTPGSGSLSTPLYLNFGPTGDLYVTSDASRRILRYDSTGAPKPSAANPGTAFFTSTINTPSGAQPVGLTLSRDGTKLVAAYEATSAANGFVGVHDPSTGALLSSLSIGVNAWDIVALTTGEYLVSTLSNNILKVNAAITSFTTFIPAGQGGLVTPRGMEIGPDGLLYVADPNSQSGSAGRVLRFDPITGANMPAPGRSGAIHTQNYAAPGGFDGAVDVALPEPSSSVLVLASAGAIFARPRRKE